VREHKGRNNNVQCVQFLDDHSHEHYFPLRHPFPMTAPMLLGRHGQLPVRRRLGTVNGGRGRGLRDNGDDGVVAVGVEVAADGLGSVDSRAGQTHIDVWKVTLLICQQCCNVSKCSSLYNKQGFHPGLWPGL